MPKIALQLRAELENVTDLKIDGEDFRWYFKVRCDNCGEETSDFVYCTLTESQPLEGGRGEASLVLKCKLCSRHNSVDILKETLTAYNADDVPKYKTLAMFDCRGVTLTEFSPRIGWVAKGLESNTPFEIDLAEKEWYDYDDRAGKPVSIKEVSFQLTAVKH